MGVETMPKGANGDRALLKCNACATFAVILTLYELTAFRRTVRAHAVAALERGATGEDGGIGRPALRPALSAWQCATERALTV